MISRLGLVRYDPWRRHALYGQCVRHFPDAAGIQGCPDRIARGRTDRRLRFAGHLVAGLRAAREAHLSCLCAGVGVDPLEQLPVAADRHQLARDTAT